MHIGDATDGATPSPPSKGGDLLMLAAAVIIAYRLGKAEGARVKQAPSATAIFAGYFGLKAMDKVFGRMTRRENISPRCSRFSSLRASRSQAPSLIRVPPASSARGRSHLARLSFQQTAARLQAVSQ